MADLNVAVRLSGIDSGASGAIGAVQKALGGLEHAGGKASQGVLSLTNVLGSVGLAGMGLNAVKDAAMGLGNALGIGLATETENVRAKFTAFLKDSTAVDQALAMVRSEADKTPFSFQAMSSAVAGLIPSAKQAGVSLEDLTHNAEILAASHPEQGLEGAAFALREAVSGDFTSIIERFDLPRQMINDLKAQGVPNMQIVGKAMGAMGYDMSLVAGLAKTTQGRMSTFQDSIDGLRLTAGKPILAALGTQLDRLSAFVQDNQEQIGNLAAIVGQVLSDAISLAADAVMALYDVFVTIRPVVVDLFEWVRLHAAPILAAFSSDTGELGESWGDTWERIRQVTSAVWRSLEPIFNSIQFQLELFWTRIAPELLDAWDAMSSAVTEAMANIWTVIGPTVERIATWWSDHWDTISRVLEVTIGIVTRTVEIAFDILAGLFTAGLRALRGDWSGAWDAIQEYSGYIWENLKANFGDTMEILKLTLGAALQHLLNALLGWAGEAWQAMKDAGAQMVAGILAGLAGLADAIKNTLTGAVSGALDAARRLITANPLTVAVQSVTNQVFQSTRPDFATSSGGGSGGTQTTSPSQPGFDWAAYNFEHQGEPRNADGTVKRQAGGRVFGGWPYRIGEAGPETFVPRTDGYILPHGMGPSSGGIDYGRLAEAVAEAVAAQPIEVHMDGEKVARITRQHNRRYLQSGGSLAPIGGDLR